MIIWTLTFTFILVFVRAQQSLTCPNGYYTVPGFNSTRCFGTSINLLFYDAYRDCINQNATMFEPKSSSEMQTMWEWANDTFSEHLTGKWFLWINYHDISTKLLLSEWQSEVDGKGPLVINSTYMGSLTTFQQMPNDFWAEPTPKNRRPDGKHCAGYYEEPDRGVFTQRGAFLLTDNDGGTSVCEKPAINTGEENEF